jgi:hypothetical protein
MKSTIFWDVGPCSLVEFRRWFGATYCFHPLLLFLTHRPWRWRLYILAKRRWIQWNTRRHILELVFFIRHVLTISTVSTQFHFVTDFTNIIMSYWFLLSLLWYKPSVKYLPTPWLCNPLRTLFPFRIDAQSSLLFAFCHNLINFSSCKSFSSSSILFSLGLPTFLLFSDSF